MGDIKKYNRNKENTRTVTQNIVPRPDFTRLNNAHIEQEQRNLKRKSQEPNMDSDSHKQLHQRKVSITRNVGHTTPPSTPIGMPSSAFAPTRQNSFDPQAESTPEAHNSLNFAQTWLLPNTSDQTPPVAAADGTFMLPENSVTPTKATAPIQNKEPQNPHTFPEDIRLLAKTKHLILSDTGITELPDTISSLTSLTRLDLGNLKLKTLPIAITHLESLRDLHIENTQIQWNALPEEVQNWLIKRRSSGLTSVHGLKIPSDQELISGKILKAEKNGQTECDLSNMSFRQFPNSIFFSDSIDQITHLNISENLFATLPVSITKFTQLRHLNLKNTNIKWENLPASVQNWLVNKASQTDPSKKLTIEGITMPVDLTGYFFGKIHDLPLSAEYCNLSHAGLRNIPLTIENKTNLRNLDLSHNPDLKSLPVEITTLENLTFLDLRQTNIQFGQLDRKVQDWLRDLIDMGCEIKGLEIPAQ